MAWEASMYDNSYIQWKVAMARMQDANMAATEITEQGELSRPTYRRICSRLLFQDGRGGIESSPKAVRRAAMISPYESASRHP
jgi:hypothetical protein